MSINSYLDYRNLVKQVRGVCSLSYCFKWGLEYFDYQAKSDGTGFEFAPQSSPLLKDWKQHITQLIKQNLRSLEPWQEEWGRVDDFVFNPDWSEEELDQRISDLLQRRLDSYLLKPGPRKPCIYGIDYQIEDVVAVIEKKLDEE